MSPERTAPGSRLLRARFSQACYSSTTRPWGLLLQPVLLYYAEAQREAANSGQTCVIKSNRSLTALKLCSQSNTFSRWLDQRGSWVWQKCQKGTFAHIWQSYRLIHQSKYVQPSQCVKDNDLKKSCATIRWNCCSTWRYYAYNILINKRHAYMGIYFKHYIF